MDILDSAEQTRHAHLQTRVFFVLLLPDKVLSLWALVFVDYGRTFTRLSAHMFELCRIVRRVCSRCTHRRNQQYKM